MHLLTLSAAAALLCSALVDAHMSMGFPVPRAHPKNKNSPFTDFQCIMAPLTAGPACGAKPFPCGYQRDTVITQTLRAGQVIDVEFFNQNFPNGPQPGDESRDQARHSGGLCEFSLSVDDGKSFHVIASYTQGCPDIFFKFPVKIPDDIPSSDAAIFAWSWINASGNREFYMNCADVKLIGKPDGKLSGKDITKANLPGVPGFEKTITPTADVNPLSNTKGPGPSKAEVDKNRGGNNGGRPSPSPIAPPAASPAVSPIVAPPKQSGNRESGLLAQRLENAKNANKVGQSCTSGSAVCLGSDSVGLCDNGKIVQGGSCSDIGLSCFNVPLVSKVGVVVSCLSKSDFDARLQAALASKSSDSSPTSPDPVVKPSPSPSPRSRLPSPSPLAPSTGSFRRDNGLLSQQQEATKDDNVVGQNCEKEVCLGSLSFGLCDNGKIVFGGNCGNGLQCFHAPLVNKPGTTVTCMRPEEYKARLDAALSS